MWHIAMPVAGVGHSIKRRHSNRRDGKEKVEEIAQNDLDVLGA